METSLLHHHGQTYKIGLRGCLYVMRDNDWVKSNNMTIESFNKELKKQNEKARY